MELPETVWLFTSSLLGVQMRKLRPREVKRIDHIYPADRLTKQKLEQNSHDYYNWVNSHMTQTQLIYMPLDTLETYFQKFLFPTFEFIGGTRFVTL